MEESKTLEQRLNEKVKTGEISEAEFQELFSKFQELGLLGSPVQGSMKRKSLLVTGKETITGDLLIDGNLSVYGGLIVNGSVECKKASVNGKAEVKRHFYSKSKVIVTGKLSSNTLNSGGKISIAGTMKINQDIQSEDEIKVSGKLVAGGTVMSTQKIVVLGSVTSDSIKSQSTIKVNGKVYTNGNVEAKKFVALIPTSSVISGSLLADEIEIGNESSENPIFTLDLNILDDEEEIPDFVTNLLKNILPKSINLNFEKYFGDPFTIKGDLIGDKIYLTNVHVHGDVRGRSVKLGKNVEINGKLYYTQSLNADTELQDIEIIQQ